VLATIITAVLGGLVFLATRWFLERRNRIVSGRAAARLIEDEMSDANSLIESSLRKGVWLDEPGAVISTARWEEHRAALAEAPRFKGWYAVVAAAGYLADIHRRATAAKLHMGARIGEGNLPEDYLGYGLINCEIAVEALNDYAKTPSYKSERVRELQELTNEIIEHMEQAKFLPIEQREPKRLDRPQGKSHKRSRRTKRRR
jgi:hypothetical protein